MLICVHHVHVIPVNQVLIICVRLFDALLTICDQTADYNLVPSIAVEVRPDVCGVTDSVLIYQFNATAAKQEHKLRLILPIQILPNMFLSEFCRGISTIIIINYLINTFCAQTRFICSNYFLALILELFRKGTTTFVVNSWTFLLKPNLPYYLCKKADPKDNEDFEGKRDFDWTK